MFYSGLVFFEVILEQKNAKNIKIENFKAQNENMYLITKKLPNNMIWM